MNRLFLQFIFTILLFCITSCAYAERKDILYSLYSADFSTNQTAEKTLGFSLEAELGLNFTTGNSENSTFNGSLLANHELLDWSNRYSVEADFSQNRAESDPITTAQRYNVSIEADYKLLDPNRRIFFFADYEDDEFDGFESQSSIAAGWARVKLQSKSSTFRYSIGPGYNIARPVDSDDEDPTGFIVRGTVEYIYQWSSGARIRQTLSTEAGKTNSASSYDVAITTKVIDSLSMQISLELDHNTSPGTDIQKLDTRTSVSLVYQFF